LQTNNVFSSDVCTHVTILLLFCNSFRQESQDAYLSIQWAEMVMILEVRKNVCK